MRKILVLLLLWGISAGLFAEHQYYRFRSNGYYFRPPRTLYFMRPDYLFNSYHSYRFYRSYGPYGSVGSYGSFHSGYPAQLGYGYTPDWVGGPRGTYSLYIGSPAGMEVVRSNTADLIFSVTPERAMVYLDGKLIGSARDLASERDRYMVLDGRHELRVEYPGFKPFQTELHVDANRTVHLDIELDPLPQR